MMAPTLTSMNGAQSEPELQRLHAVCAVLDKVPMGQLLGLAALIQDPSPEELLKNWQAQSSENSSIRLPEDAMTAETVVMNVENPGKMSPVIAVG